MQVLLSKFKFACTNIVKLLLDNGQGRAVKLTESKASDPSGFSVFIKFIVDSIVSFLMDIGETLLRLLARIVYFIARICLNLMDFMSIVIKQLSGQATAYNLKENANLQESDILFQFLFNEVTLKVLRGAFVLGLILLVIFTIMAIVKTEWQNHIEGKLGNVKKIFRKLLISLFSMLIVPFILIVGIVFSNVILSSIMSSLSGQSGSYSLGAQIFSSCSYDANRYRIYAQEGAKIPIVFDFGGGFEGVDTTHLPEPSTSSTKAQEEDIKEMVEGGAYTTGENTYNMFIDQAFFNFEGVGDNSAYYNVYDGPYLKTKRIEYYVMADFIDFVMASGETFYIANVQDVYFSALAYLYENGDYPENKTERDALTSVLDSIVAYDEAGEVIKPEEGATFVDIAQGIADGSIIVDKFTFDVYYNSKRADVIGEDGIGADGKYTYTSVADSTDEVTGAKYVFCSLTSIGEDGRYIYSPVRVNSKFNNNKFKTSFLASAPLDAKKKPLREESFFLAKGAFTSNGYPTAIQQEGDEISFYRHEVFSPAASNLSQIFNYVDKDQAQAEEEGWGNSIFEYVTGVDISNLVPDIKVNLNFFRAYSKSYGYAAGLKNGEFVLNYSFANTHLAMYNIYDELRLNYVVLAFAAATLFASLFYIIWGLIMRIYEITLLWITMPGWIAKFPLEKDNDIGGSKTSFSNWKDKIIERVLSLYSVYIAVALVLLLVPIVYELDYITTFNIEETNLFSIFNADIANLVIKTAFVLVLFTMLNVSQKNKKGEEVGLMGTVEMLLQSKDANKGTYIAEVGQTTFADIKKAVNQAKENFTIKGITTKVKGEALNVTKATLNAIPGRSLADRLLGDTSDMIFNYASDKKLKEEQKELLSKTTDADIDAAAGKLSERTGDHKYMEDYRTARHDYWRDTGKGLKEDFRGRDKKDPMAEVARRGTGSKVDVGGKKKKQRQIYAETVAKYFDKH